MTTDVLEPIEITLIDRVQTGDTGCTHCGARGYRVERHRRSCGVCPSMSRKQAGAIHRQTVLVDPAVWPLKNTVVEREVYEAIRHQVGLGRKPAAFALDRRT